MSTVITVGVLKGAAKSAGLTGLSKARKAEIEQAVMSHPKGRKAIYQFHEAKQALGIVAEIHAKGFHSIPKPTLETVEEFKLPSSISIPQSVLRQLKFEYDTRVRGINARNRKAMASFWGIVTAVQDAIVASGFYNITWEERPDSFVFGRVRKAAA